MRSLSIVIAISLPAASCFLVIPRQLHAQRSVPPRASASLALRDDLKGAAVAALVDNLKGAAVAALVGLVLVSSPLPAHAKGGGHGGGHSGGHSSYHSSSSSSSRRTLHPSVRSSPRRSRSSSQHRSSGYGSRGSSSTVVSSSPPPPLRLYPDASTARREDGFYCPTSLPQAGEKVDVLADPDLKLPRRTATVISSQPASQASLFGGDGSMLLEPIPGFESDCSVTVRFEDGTVGTVSAAEQPKPIIEEVAPPLVYAAIGYGYGALMDDTGVWERAEKHHEKLLEELAAAAKQGGDNVPLSGEYWGSSEESDEGDQAVRTKLGFGSNGEIKGSGRDGVDGSYRISRGRWGVLDGETKPTVAWIEQYDEGFKVAVKGSYDVRTGKIEARFTSSRGVRGSFELSPKPSIF